MKWTDPSSLLMTAASLGVIGGYVDYLRVGGIVTLRPFCLISPTDTLASRLAGVYHCCAMLVSQSPQNGVVEVVLMERSSKPVREGSAKGKAIISSSSSSKTLQYNATTLSTALPVRAVRVNASDIVPSPDVPEHEALACDQVRCPLFQISFISQHPARSLSFGEFFDPALLQSLSVTRMEIEERLPTLALGSAR